MGVCARARYANTICWENIGERRFQKDDMYRGWMAERWGGHLRDYCHAA